MVFGELGLPKRRGHGGHDGRLQREAARKTRGYRVRKPAETKGRSRTDMAGGGDGGGNACEIETISKSDTTRMA